MAILPILTVPDPRLKLISKPVDQVDDRLAAMMDDMLETMYAANGIGLAAIQIGEPVRVIVMDIDWSADVEEGQDAERNPRFFINPELSAPSDNMVPYEEGCLSVPQIYDTVERPDKVLLRYLDRDGKPQEEVAEGLFATCIQHEMDHLNGVVFLDHLSRLKRDRAIAKLRKARRLDAA